MNRSNANLALALGTAALRMKRGIALDAEARRQLVELLLRGAMALHGGHQLPSRLDADPHAVITVAVEIAREAGLTGMELATAFNDAIERSPIGGR
ncbi:hypothetical protein D3093_30045 (plasmid) [Azospirillum argentinense]|uniref:Uncharacterized protein n=1 Tax=Azospirillum argentinense TaxID=2970906 RepID=A0A4D8PL17_9PROT|nr:hypothetical protein [Azospirillum argentinense]QCN98896.1 hypothetical protein D3093_26785 [Azospirillum argentinense]QCN99467.1 hypothetical protein D3093_30045 [Azospirillum argentinense]